MRCFLSERPVAPVRIAVAWLPAALLLATSAAFADEFEKAGKVQAAAYLPKEEMTGEEWKVAAEAENDGATNTYVVESRFGRFAARGRSGVAVRAHEIQALRELERVSKTEVFVNAVKDSSLGSVRTVLD